MNLKTWFFRKRISVTPELKMHSPNLEEVKPLQEEVVNPNFGMVIKTYDKREMKNFISPGEDNGDNPGDDPDENPDEDLDENSVEEVQIQESIKHDNSGISMNNHIKEVIARNIN